MSIRTETPQHDAYETLRSEIARRHAGQSRGRTLLFTLLAAGLGVRVRKGNDVAGFKSITDIFWPLVQKPETNVQGLINTGLTAIIMFAAVIIMIDSIRRWLGTRNHPEITPIQEPLFEKSV